MGKVSRVRDHVSVEEIQALLRTVEGQKHRDKLMVDSACNLLCQVVDFQLYTIQATNIA